MGTAHIQPNTRHLTESMTAPDWAAMRRAFQPFTIPLDTVQILRSCVPELAGDPFEIRECAILDAKLKTYLKPTSKKKSSLSACYQLTLREGVTGSISQRILYIKVFLGGQSREVLHQITQNGMSNSDFCHAVLFVPEHDLILWRFPHDPSLPHLRHLVDLLAVEQYLPVEGLTQLGVGGRPQVLERHLVNYRPEIRCTNRYTVYDATQDWTGELFGKTFGDAQGQALYERLQFFWDRSLADPEAMAIARPLGYSPEINTLWQRGVSGTPLLQTLVPSNYKHYIAAVAKGLASLHTSNVPTLATHSPADHLVEIHKKLTKLSDAIPQLSDLFEDVANAIEHTAPHSSTIPFRPIHWDFHIDQLLANNGAIVFCDLDELVNGDPLQDLANFVVDLHFRRADHELVALITKELCRQYGQLVDWPVSAERFAWHTRIQLVNKAYRHYLRFAPDFEGTVEQISRVAQRGFLP
ncbi:MAG: phosphotransferase [Nitrospira sp.]|nr:phosphotransferase [Nitrospira sp.]